MKLGCSYQKLGCHKFDQINIRKILKSYSMPSTNENLAKLHNLKYMKRK